MAGENRLAAIIGQPVLERAPRRHAGHRAAGHGQHAGRFLGHDEVGIFIPHDRIGQQPVRVALQRIRFDVDALQHIAEQRPALAGAGGVERPAAPHFAGRGGAVPEFADGQRLEPVLQGVLQQLRRRAVARAARRDKPPVGEDLPDRASLAPAVQHDILLEQPVLQPPRLLSRGTDDVLRLPGENRRHEPLDERASSGQSGEGVEESGCPVAAGHDAGVAILDLEDAEHLAFGENLPQTGVCVDAVNQRAGGGDDRRGRGVAERVIQHRGPGL